MLTKNSIYGMVLKSNCKSEDALFSFCKQDPMTHLSDTPGFTKLIKTGMHAQSSGVLLHAGIMEDFDQTREISQKRNTLRFGERLTPLPTLMCHSCGLYEQELVPENGDQ